MPKKDEDIKIDEDSKEIKAIMEVKGIAPLTEIEFGREDLNQLARKVNEIINHLN